MRFTEERRFGGGMGIPYLQYFLMTDVGILMVVMDVLDFFLDFLSWNVDELELF